MGALETAVALAEAPQALSRDRSQATDDVFSAA